MTGLMTPSSGKTFGRSPYAGTRRGMQRLHDPSALANHLYTTAHRDALYRSITFDDCLGATALAAKIAMFTANKDAGATTWAFNAQAGGAIRGVTGATSGDGLTLLGPAIFKGDLNCGMEITFKSDIVTTLTAEAGFINAAPTDATTPAITDIDAITFQAAPAEAAVIHIDTAETLATFALATKSATYTTNYKKTFFTPFEDPASTTGVSPVAATEITLRVQLMTDHVVGMIFGPTGNLLSESIIAPAATAALTGGIEGGTLLCPWFAVATLTTASKNVDIRRIGWWQDGF